MLNDVSWNVYVTCTFPTQTSSERAAKAWSLFTNKLARLVLSSRAARREGLPWVRGIESHASGSSHVHGLIAGLGDLSTKAIADAWTEASGSTIIDIEAPRLAGKVLGYLAKTADDGGDVDVARYFTRA